MKHAAIRRWVQLAALLCIACLGGSGCGRDAYAVVQISGSSDDRIQLLGLSATVASWQASEVYIGHPNEVSFFLPEGALGASLSVTIDAWGPACILSAGSASGNVLNRPRLDLSVQLQPATSCK